jgi:hypothetical protein
MIRLTEWICSVYVEADLAAAAVAVADIGIDI